jgi:hypothetical protein
MDQRKLPKRIEECNSNPHTETRKKPNNRRKLPTNISGELPVQGPRKDRKYKTGIHPGRKKPSPKSTVRLQKK